MKPTGSWTPPTFSKLQVESQSFCCTAQARCHHCQLHPQLTRHAATHAATQEQFSGRITQPVGQARRIKSHALKTVF